MRNVLKTIVQDYGWIHSSLGVLGDTTFFIGSILFLPRFEQIQTIAVWLFIIGSFLMLIGGVGSMLVSIWGDEG